MASKIAETLAKSTTSNVKKRDGFGGKKSPHIDGDGSGGDGDPDANKDDDSTAGDEHDGDDGDDMAHPSHEESETAKELQAAMQSSDHRILSVALKNAIKAHTRKD